MAGKNVFQTELEGKIQIRKLALAVVSSRTDCSVFETQNQFIVKISMPTKVSDEDFL